MRTLHACSFVLAASSAQAASWPRVEMPDPTSASAVRRALDGAAKRLQKPRCQKVLADFRDRQGRPLGQKLDEIGVDGARYLGRIEFREGWGTGQCEGTERLAFTTQGGRIVWVCGGRFEQAAKEDARWAEATLIHEALHTLGLGENGRSSSLAITGRVLDRCGR